MHAGGSRVIISTRTSHKSAIISLLKCNRRVFVVTTDAMDYLLALCLLVVVSGTTETEMNFQLLSGSYRLLVRVAPPPSMSA